MSVKFALEFSWISTELRPSSPHLKNFTLLLLKKYSPPGMALKQFCFLSLVIASFI